MNTRYYLLLLFYAVLLPISLPAIDRYDIIINEIMEDPTLSGASTLGLPNAEYIELYNRSEEAINLENFNLTIGSKVIDFPNYFFLPNTYLLLTKTGNEALSSYGHLLFFDNFPTLPSQQTLLLKDLFGETIDALSYQQEWFGAISKANGGYALERINPLRPCDGGNNWKASDALIGGTPGQENTGIILDLDTTPPNIVNAYPVSTNQVELSFSEAMDEATILNKDGYQIEGNSITQVNLLADNFSTVLLDLESNLSSTNIQNLQIGNTINDCVHNSIGNNKVVPIALPQKANTNDLIINEILFNPTVGGKDFVELYNRSDKVIDLNDLSLVNQTTNSTAIPIVAKRLIFPNEYIVFTESPADLNNRYSIAFPEKIVTQKLPSLADKEGNLTLFTNNNGNTIIVDQLDYSEAFHSPLLTTNEGVSIERIQFDGPTQTATNWQSAAASIGFATPTTINSQSFTRLDTTSNQPFIFSQKMISPDGDGFADFLQIRYNFEQTGTTLSLHIYDAAGRLINQVVQNESVGTNGFYKWDGQTADGRKAPIGMYVVWIEYFNLNGETGQWKEAIVVAGKL